jgi:hypothetical protein
LVARKFASRVARETSGTAVKQLTSPLMTISDGAIRKNIWRAVQLGLQVKLEAHGAIAAKAAGYVALRRASERSVQGDLVPRGYASVRFSMTCRKSVATTP